MTARTFIILAMVIVVSKIEAAATLRGFVLANGLSGRPMENVQVIPSEGNPTNTGADGKFTFIFPNKNPGDTVKLFPKKEGYEVVNDVQMELALPAHPDERLAMIVLCKEGDREEMASLFYGLKLRAAADETLRKKIEEAPNASAAKLAKQEGDQAKAAAEKGAEWLAKQQPGGGSELYQTAMRLFLD